MERIGKGKDLIGPACGGLPEAAEDWFGTLKAYGLPAAAKDGAGKEKVGFWWRPIAGGLGDADARRDPAGGEGHVGTSIASSKRRLSAGCSRTKLPPETKGETFFNLCSGKTPASLDLQGRCRSSLSF